MPHEKEYKTFIHDELSHWKKYSANGGKLRPAELPPDNPMDVVKNAKLRRYSVAYGALIDVLEARDPYTADHSKRVSAMCLRACLLLRLPRAKISAAVLAASFHDIGKVGISDVILRKEGKLSQSEFQEIKRHAVIGSDILLKNDGLEDVATDVRHHHERWDGGGYPDGLCGADIPLVSRIIAICDSIDAMRSDRPYRKGLTDAVCRQEIEKNTAAMYDPALVSLFLGNWAFITDGLYTGDNI